MIAAVARSHSRDVFDVAGDSYAKTLWCFLHHEDAKRLDKLDAERDRIGLAEMVATGFHDPKRLVRFETDWRRRALVTPTRETVEEMSRRADDLWDQHERALVKKRPVS